MTYHLAPLLDPDHFHDCIWCFADAGLLQRLFSDDKYFFVTFSTFAVLELSTKVTHFRNDFISNHTTANVYLKNRMSLLPKSSKGVQV